MSLWYSSNSFRADALTFPAQRLMAVLPALITALVLFVCVAPAYASAVSSGNYTYTVIDEGQKTARLNRIAGAGGAVVIPDTIDGYMITAIGNNYLSSIFEFHNSVTSVTIPVSVTSIDERAFYNCTELTSITIPSGVTSIGNYAFDSCTSLTGITVPDSVTSIGGWAFYACQNLTSLLIPANVTSIGCQAFDGCSSLTGAYFYGNAPAIFGRNVFADNSPGFTIYYLDGHSGWTSPTWKSPGVYNRYDVYNTATFVPCTVTFDSQGGSMVDSITAPSNTTLTAPAAPTKEGGAFGGWYKEAACLTPWVFETDTVTADTTLYARWEGEGEDTTAPSWTGSNLAASNITQSSLTLTWSGATDNVALTGYKVYRGGTLLTAGPVSGTSYNVTDLSPSTAYTFSVQAVDAAGNQSTDGPSVTVQTTESSGGGGVTLELSKYTAQPGDSVTMSGTAGANMWVSIKVLDSAPSIIAFDAVKSDANGNYSCTFIVPDTAKGSLTVVAGYGYNVAGKTLTVTSSSSGGGSSTPKAVNSATGTATVNPKYGGTISLSDEAGVKIPANALQGTTALEVKIQQVKQPPAAPEGFRLTGAVYEFTVGGLTNYSLAKKATINLTFDTNAISTAESPVMQYYAQAQSRWISIGGTISGNKINVQVDHFGKFAVMIAGQAEQQLTTSIQDSTGHWALADIKKLISLGAITGYPDGSFKPNNTITRAEFAAVLAKAFQLEPQSGQVFADTADHWARDYIATAAAGGMVKGYNSSTFGPNDPITREQMAVMLVKAAGLAPAAADISFSDSTEISGWARAAVAAAAEKGIMGGYPDNTIQPQGNATRAEAATVMVKALSYQSR